MNDEEDMKDYEVIIEAYKILKKINSMFYGQTDFSRNREIEAHFHLGMLNLLLYNQIKDEDESLFED